MNPPLVDVLPPHDLEAERGALACVLSGTPEEAAAWLVELASEEFYDERHRVIFDALSKLSEAGKPIDAVSLYTALRDAGQLDEVGGLEYITALPDATPSPANFPSWLARVRDFRQRRADLAEAVRLRERALAGVEKIESREDVIRRLRSLPQLDYEQQRDAAAKILGCRTSVLDKLVAEVRSGAGEPQGGRLKLDDVEPWPDPVNGAEILREVADTFRRYVFLPGGAADALALWAAHTHVFDQFQCSPRLNIRSEHKGCGKTTLRDVLTCFVSRPLSAENLSAAVLFRVTESHKPTVLADECDAWLRDNEELRGMLNAGHRRGGVALRCEGDDHEVRAFSVFTPVVLCGIGALPGTLHDRSIVIRLERARPGELRERFDSRRTEPEKVLAQKLARFAVDNAGRLQGCNPVLPPGAFNRVADNWRPLFAVAEIAGADWPQRAAEAFALLNENEDLDAHGIGVTLLGDISTMFAPGPDKLKSCDIVGKLHQMEGREWVEWGKSRKPISANQMAKLLSRFKVSPRTIKLSDGTTAKGYHREMFNEAFARYLPDTHPSKRNPVTMPVNIDDSAVSETSPPETGLRMENVSLTNKNGVGYGVTVQKPLLVEELA